MKKNLLNMIIIILVLAGALFLINKKMDSIEKYEKVRQDNSNFNLRLIKEVNKNKKTNYLISPYSIEIALSMLKDGSSGNTHKELSDIIPNRSIKLLDVKDHISVANALFIKDAYSNSIKKSFVNDMKSKYASEIIYDSFKTPDMINKWVDEKTKHMINKILDSINPNFVVGLSNALAIDVEWQYKFECNMTSKEKFNSPTGVVYVEGMNKAFDEIEYIDLDGVKGIVLPYKTYSDVKGENINLEFIGLMPEKSLNDYIDNLTEDDISKIIDSRTSLKNNERLNLMLPRFEYDYTIDDFIGVLNAMGIKAAFTESANFKNITEKEIYVGEAVHKTHIDLSENGTKAAAVTYFGLLEKSMVVQEKKEINMAFDKPFMYIIREKNSGEMLFVGAVYEPNKWQGNTCKSEE